MSWSNNKYNKKRAARKRRVTNWRSVDLATKETRNLLYRPSSIQETKNTNLVGRKKS
jgi:hypothetical protein